MEHSNKGEERLGGGGGSDLFALLFTSDRPHARAHSQSLLSPLITQRALIQFCAITQHLPTKTLHSLTVPL